MCSSPDILVVKFVSFSLFALKKKKGKRLFKLKEIFKKGSHRCHPYGREGLPVSQHDAIALNPAEVWDLRSWRTLRTIIKYKEQRKVSRGPNEDTGIENAY